MRWSHWEHWKRRQKKSEDKKTGNGSLALTWSKAALFILDRTRTP